jgi:hypothetical protein
MKRLPDAQNVLDELIFELQHVQDRNGRGSYPQQEVTSIAYEQLAVVYGQMGELKKAEEATQIAREMKRQLQFGPGGHGGGPGGFGGGPGGPGGPPGGVKGPPPKKN